MLKYSELTATSLVIDRTGEVVPFYMASLTTDSESKVFPASFSLGLVNVDPVLITDEWLDRLGFKAGSIIWKEGAFGLKMYKNSIRDGSGRYEGVTFSQMIGSLTEHHIYNSCCRYLHELQNFYYTFTKEELKIPER